MIITIGGYPGSGKGTVGRLVASKLGYEYYSMGDIWGETARKRGMTLNEFHQFLQKHPEFDRELDAYQESLGKQDNLVVDSRLGYHFIPHALKVFLTVDWKVGSERIHAAHRDDEKYETLKHAEQHLRERAAHERKQYKAIYHTDHYDVKNYDLVIDTSTLSPEQVAKKILSALAEEQR